MVPTLALVVSCTDSGSSARTPVEEVGARTPTVPAAARRIMNKPPYESARWLYYVADMNSGEVLLANRPDEMVFTASTAKLFTVATALDVLGPNYRVTTPVYATGPVRGGVVDGDLALVTKGDLALGGRGAPNDNFNYTFTADQIDHVYGDVAPNGAEPKGDPMAGLNDLARQVAATGVTRVDGDVLVDDRFWQTFEGQEGVVPPTFVNDNLLDITVTPAAVGENAGVVDSPQSAVFTVVPRVRTVRGSESTVEVAADPADPGRLVVKGTIGASTEPRQTVHRVPDAATWTRALFVKALRRAGVAVDADSATANPPPPAAPYRKAQRLAALESPPLKEFGKMILATSYNTGANALLCHLAVNAGSTDCLDGLQPIRDLIDEAGLASDKVVLIDGQGADPASVTSVQISDWLRWTQEQPWAAAYRAGLPVLGESGTLASVGAKSPARGKVVAKTGTSAHADPVTGGALFNVQSLAGFMETDDGRTLVFNISMSGGTYPDVLAGLVGANADVAGVAAAFQQSLTR